LVDKDRSGNIQSSELAQIQFNNQPIGINVATKLIKVFDKDGSGSIGKALLEGYFSHT